MLAVGRVGNLLCGRATYITYPSQCIPIPTRIKKNKWTKISYKRGTSGQNETKTKTKHYKESEHGLNQTFTSNRYTALLEEESEDQQHKTGPENKPKPPSIYITDIKNISQLIEFLEQIARQQYKIKSLADSQVKIQPKASECYRTIIKSIAKKCTEFHTYKLKEERSFKVVLKHMHYSNNPEEIKTEIEKLGHTVTNICNIKHHGTKLMFFVEL
jgi:hypothetical protein